MAREKYLSTRSSVNGFSFANLGLFTGFADGIYNAVYSLVILEIFKDSAIVGIYVSIYSLFCMIVALFANEIFRQFSKVRVFYFALLALSVCYAMMGFSVQPSTFITLDYTSGFAITLTAMLIPLFMSDFSGKDNMSKLNSRYHLWVNIGALFAPMIAVAVATRFDDNRSAFFISSIIYLVAWGFFKYMGIIQEDKKIKPVNPRRTIKSLLKNTIAFFKTPGMLRAYAVNFGFYSLSSMRHLYVPILVMEQFNDKEYAKDMLGLVLTLGIIPYIVLSWFMGRLVMKYGKKLWMILGFGSFAVFSLWATVATGYPLLGIFVAWQVSGALMEPVHDLLFFDDTKKSQQTKFYGVFRTSSNLPKFIVPVAAAACITLFGATSAVWYVTAAICCLSLLLLIAKK
ncbi:MAG: MFS transporter [Alphaproteobacteria bacterium]|nr:MFS transporter [Alphaproteobacteria bacterium]